MQGEIPKIGQTSMDQQLLGRRDAFHVPCVLAMSDTCVYARDRVRFISAEFTSVEPVIDVSESHGVADPFMPNLFAEPGTLFWVILAPGLATNLTHHFTIGKGALILQEDYELMVFEEENSSTFQEDDGCRGCNS